MPHILHRPCTKGFSYVGILIMIAIMGAMSASALTAGAMMQRRASEEELLFVGKQFQSAIKSYYESTPPGSKPYPTQLVDLLRDPRITPTRRHLRKVFADPLTGKSNWGIVEAPGGGILGVYSQSQETPIRVGGFDPELASFEGKSKYSEWVFRHIPITLNTN